MGDVPGSSHLTDQGIEFYQERFESTYTRVQDQPFVPPRRVRRAMAYGGRGRRLVSDQDIEVLALQQDVQKQLGGIRIEKAL